MDSPVESLPVAPPIGTDLAEANPLLTSGLTLRDEVALRVLEARLITPAEAFAVADAFIAARLSPAEKEPAEIS